MIYTTIAPYLKRMIETDASDLFLTVGAAPSLRIENKVMPLDLPALAVADIDAIVEELLNDDQREEFSSTLELNIALMTEDKERFRANFYYQQHYIGLVIRRIKAKIPSIDTLGLSSAYKEAIMRHRGLVLVVGATGSGKSTSLASMLEYRNENGSGHIITIEDPIEFVHDHKNCIFMQREIGIDTYSYGIALKNALRQSPDVIVIGEIRDRETLEDALLFCETGHLVVATMHASNTAQTIERIINLFPEELHNQVLTTLAQNLEMIVAQRLVQDISGNRVLANEIMINEGLISLLIEEGKIKEIKEVIEKSKGQGMMTMDQSLVDLIGKGIISMEVGMKEADNPNNLRLRITQSKNFSESTTLGEIELARSSYEKEEEKPAEESEF